MTSTGASVAPHVPVLVNEVIAALAIAGGETVVDGTFGAGGYSRAMLAAGAGRVLGFDRDPDAIQAGRSFGDPRLELIQDNFSQMDRALADRGIGLVDAIALDIGVSSMQIDRAERGFSFQADGPLDMRMSQSGLTAAEFLNSADEADIARVLRDYGEEPRARAIARAIIASRPVERTAQLAAIVRRAAGFRPGQKSDPATRTFQAIRIHLNAELDELEQGLEAAERALKPGGRLAVVTFHSLEDRIVKRFFRERSGATPAGSRHRPASPIIASRPSNGSPSRFPPRSMRSPSILVRARRGSGAPSAPFPPSQGTPAMSSRSFRSVFMVASCAGAALSCYLVSLRVASERAALEDVETRIVLAQQDMRMVQTEIGTRGRLSQLERWNAGAFALSAPSADQFLKGGFELARLAQPEHKPDFQAPVVLASAPAPAPHQLVVGRPETDDSGAPAPPPPTPCFIRLA